MTGRVLLAVLYLTAILHAGSRREAFTRAVAHHPSEARAMLPAVIDEPWVGQVSFLQALEVARGLPPELQSRFLIASAGANAPVAVREVGRYAELPCAPEVFEAGALFAPDDAVAAASGRSPAAEKVARAIRAGGRKELQILARLLSAPVDDVTRQRAAVFVPYVDPSSFLDRLGDDASYLRILADTRLARAEAPVLDRALENFARMTLVSIRDGGPHELGQLSRYSARDVYLLLTYGRTEGGAGVFAKVYDRYLAPKIRGRGTLEAARYLGLRHFLSLTVAHARFHKFLRALGPEAVQMAVLARVVKDVHSGRRPLEEAIAAAEVLDSISEPSRVRALGAILRDQHAQVALKKDKALYGMLAVRISRRFPADSTIATLANPYAPHVKETRSLNVGAIAEGETIVQRHLFWNDEDGVESFGSFRQTYAADPRWRFEMKDGYVHLSAKGSTGRRVEIFANVPADIFAPANRNIAHDIEERHNRVSDALRRRGLTPQVVVHRGHSYHLEKSLPYFTPAAKLVYLGSCNGMDKMASVSERAASAQIIATRGVGTMSINDPVLKAINDELLEAGHVDWTIFWRRLERSFGNNGMFRDYIGPHQNAAASLLGAYFDLVGRD